MCCLLIDVKKEGAWPGPGQFIKERGPVFGRGGFPNLERQNRGFLFSSEKENACLPPEPRLREQTADDSPFPGGEGWGEGELSLPEPVRLWWQRNQARPHPGPLPQEREKQLRR